MLASFESVIASTSHHYKSTYFCHPFLSEDEIKSGCILGLDSWADTGCSGKHAYIGGFVEGKSVSVTGNTSTLRSIDKIPIARVLYAFYKEDGTLLFLEHNTTIYMGGDMIDSLANTIQCEDNDVRFNLRPKVYHPNNNNTQLITFPDGTSIPVNYNRVLP